MPIFYPNKTHMKKSDHQMSLLTISRHLRFHLLFRSITTWKETTRLPRLSHGVEEGVVWFSSPTDFIFFLGHPRPGISVRWPLFVISPGLILSMMGSSLDCMNGSMVMVVPCLACVLVIDIRVCKSSPIQIKDPRTKNYNMSCPNMEKHIQLNHIITPYNVPCRVNR